LDTYRERDVTTEAEEVEEPQAEERAGRGCGCWILVLLVLLAGGAATGYLMGTIVLRQETPLPGETAIADLALRYIAVPPEYADMRIPTQYLGPDRRPKPDVLARGKELFETQCAICHGQNGDGNGPLGKTMYPPASDLRQARTQTKSDGQLYWLTAHGINLTGMPAWGEKYGGPNSDDEIWSMVAYMRSLAAGSSR
jgi:mono/diheme cytochrome c family protein